MGDELKPCPFCGGEAAEAKDGEYYLVRCDNCRAEQYRPIKSIARSAWNARAIPPEVTALVEALRRAIEAIDAAYDGPDDNGRYSTRERAALAAWEAAQ